MAAIRLAAPGAGDLGWIVAEHGRYYRDLLGLPLSFEAKVAEGLASLVLSPADGRSAVFVAWLGDERVGSVAIDGSDPQGWGRLRFFIVSEAARGQGVGRALIDSAMAHCHACGFERMYLTTVAGLDAARRLYEASGFQLADAHEDATWGRRLCEQRFEWHRPTEAAQ
ncbi:MAG: GNAT family N-acetyltransferase [Proteobacteria bacterium]|nr:MAG: GNAT family N-acetyltransferase [Pseudomonadota bacterium]